MAAVDVPELVQRWSMAVAATRVSLGEGRAPLAVRASGSVLVAPATADEVRAAEDRLGVRLPPSYTDFLRTSNGAYASEHLQDQGSRPEALLPVEAIGRPRLWAAEAIDILAGECDPPTPDGRSDAFDGDEVSYLSLEHPDEPRYGNLLHALHIGATQGLDVYLDPLTVGPGGEWEVVTVGTQSLCWRYPSFAAFLDGSAERARTETAAPPGWTDAALPSALEVLQPVDVEEVAGRLVAQVSDPAIDVHVRRAAFGLLGHLDDVHGGGRQVALVPAVVADRSLQDVGVVRCLWEGWGRGDTPDGSPSVTDVLRLGRPGDEREMASLPAETIRAMGRVEDASVLQPHLRRHGLDADAPPAARVLGALLVDRRIDGDRARAVPADDRSVTADDLAAAAERMDLRPEAVVVRALVALGRAEEAVAWAVGRIRPSDPGTVAYEISAVSTPKPPGRLSTVPTTSSGPRARCG